MKIRLTERLQKSYNDAPARVQRAFDKQCLLLADNLQHPSLRAKKYDESLDVWQARVDGSWRFYFVIEQDTYVIIGLKPHPR